MSIFTKLLVTVVATLFALLAVPVFFYAGAGPAFVCLVIAFVVALIGWGGSYFVNLQRLLDASYERPSIRNSWEHMSPRARLIFGVALGILVVLNVGARLYTLYAAH